MALLKTLGEQAQEVQAAITAVMQGSQEYEFNGRRVRRADLQWLQQRAEYLDKQLQIHGDIIIGSTITRGSAGISFE